MNVEKMTKEEILMCLGDVNEELIYQKELVAKKSDEIRLLRKQLKAETEKSRQEKLNKEKSRIIKKGTKTPPDKQIYVTKCRVCGSIFTYKIEDMHYKEKTGLVYVICPACEYPKYPFINRKYKGNNKE